MLSSNDSWPGLRDAARTLTGHLARARYVDVPGGADHGIPPEATAKAVDAFLGGDDD
ncbi:hypothetical protein [Qaidamihabitans albus]|uniref:hypothetical protein n=1 Tax=Qaidamihabitans albus TaxID=2795733 RepID=UPI001F1C754C|nr:hypothetical protein [Qaidamihabitans albus]